MPGCCDKPALHDPPATAAARREASPTLLHTALRRTQALLQWTLPIATLALMPKCPGCVAAYILLFTGIGLSLPAAGAVRWTLVGVSVAALSLLSLRLGRRLRARSAAH